MAAPSADVDRSLMLVQVDGGFGSGFLYGDNRTLVTNRHVVEGLRRGDPVQLRPVVADASGWTDLGRKQPGIVRYLHPDLDLAVIEVGGQATGRPLSTWTGDGRVFAPRGTRVLAHGFPSLASPMISRGVICGHWRDPTSDQRFYLTDAAMAEGSSGGPLTDEQGRLVGVTVAIYDFPDELGFNWGLVIPAANLGMVFPGGPGLHGLPEFLDIDELVRQFCMETVSTRRFSRGISAIDRIATVSGSAAELIENYDRYVRGIERNLTVNSPADGRGLIRFCIRSGSIIAGRMAVYGMRGDYLTLDSEQILLELDSLLTSVSEREIARVFGKQSSAQGAEIVFVMLECVTELVNESLVGLDDACGSIERIGLVDQVEARDIQTEAVIDDIARLVTASVLMESLTESVVELPSVANARRNLPEHLVERYARCRAAMDRAIADWDRLPSGCRMFLEGVAQGGALRLEPDGEQDIQAIRGLWQAIGGIMQDRDSILLEPEEARVLTWTIGSGVDFLGVLAVAERTDIDLVLRDPGDNIVAIDEEYDAWPVVQVFSPAVGEWTIAVVNNSASQVWVEVEVWE
ncbi:MAG: serine protease [Phycisphaerales bacterium]|nr:serine protease [Phycisphaerales bacterium]